jgi:ABC-type sugar transport system substrate-binding protein
MSVWNEWQYAVTGMVERAQKAGIKVILVTSEIRRVVMLLVARMTPERRA